MRYAIAKENGDLVAANYKYTMQITGDNDEGKRELDNFINPEEKYPVVVTTSELMTTGVDAQTCKVIVLDANINSMTKFKQIIGRGTRINEDYGKLFFTILDFRNATDLFADKEFDGDPIRIKEGNEDTDLGNIDSEEEETPIIDEETGEEIKIVEPPTIRTPEEGNSELPTKREKVFVNGVDVSVLVSRELHFDQNGKPITTSLKEHTRGIIKGKFKSLDNFIKKWSQAEKKEAIIAELQDHGILIHALFDAVDSQLDLFDLICHLAYDQPPLTRRERANNVKKRNHFTKYGETARKVLESLLDKYAEQGISEIESMEILRLQPLSDFGSPLEIIKEFGSKVKYLEAVKELEFELYKSA